MASANDFILNAMCFRIDPVTSTLCVMHRKPFGIQAMSISTIFLIRRWLGCVHYVILHVVAKRKLFEVWDSIPEMSKRKLFGVGK